jgi:nicotinate-nucleotide pyrophosphorylase (carboxylating)
MLTESVINAALKIAFDEDSPTGDLTSGLLFPRDARVQATMVAREAGVMCGVDLIEAAFRFTDANVDVTVSALDGESFTAGQLLVTVSGNAIAILRAERIALNFVQRMCGVATMTRSFVDAISHTKARIVDTRKTTPGLRAFEKYAVTCGGGINHRFSLSDAVLVKDNHLAELQRLGISPEAALRSVRDKAPFTTHIEVEVDRLDQIETVLASGVVDSVLIDNFGLEDIHRAVALIGSRALVNASGGIRTAVQARAIAEAGVDLLSIGAITHSVAAIDIGLDMEFF